MSARRILHVLAQRPSRTGSGITLDCMVREAAKAGWDQRVLAGVPGDDDEVAVGELSAEHIDTVRFSTPELPFAVPGMSDVMPYESTVYSSMNEEQLSLYREAFGRAILDCVRRFQPALIHVHHVWILASMLKDLAPSVPVVNHCHATGLRQMQLCPHLAPAVRLGCARNEAFVALHEEQAIDLARSLEIPRPRVHVVGAGYREDVFHAPPQAGGAPRQAIVAYAGKLAEAKGLPALLDAFALLRRRMPEAQLWLAGAAAGEEGQRLRARAERTPGVRLLGRRSPQELAADLRQAAVFALPSLYEGLPLVLVEAAACGCRLVATDLPGVVQGLAPSLGEALDLVKRPRTLGLDTVHPEAAGSFAEELAEALHHSLRQSLQQPAPPAPQGLADFTWSGVFGRVQKVWEDVLAERSGGQRSGGQR